MSTIVRARLRDEFREPLTSKIGFVGRETELARLGSLLKHRRSATLLISGHRGVGKTTLVNEAIERSRPEKGERLVARMTLPHLYPAQDPQDLRSQVLRSLARALYFSAKDHKKVSTSNAKAARELYTKTYLTSFQTQSAIGSIAEAEARREATESRDRSIDLGKSTQALFAGVFGVGGIAAGLAVVSSIGARHGLGWALVAGALLVGFATAAGVTLHSAVTKTTSITKKATEKSEVTQVGTFDVTPETLEFELTGLISALVKGGFQVVFVIDELDKLEIHEDTPDRLTDHVIFKIVGTLKNLFTLSAAIFIFISGEDFYARLLESIDTDPYSLTHTLFTDRVFVHVLAYRDLEALIDQLLLKAPTNDLAYRQFRNYLCWESRSHVFDLLGGLNDYISFDKTGHPELLVRVSGLDDLGTWREGNLPNDWVDASGLQKYVGAAFDESVRPESRRERFNQALWLTLLDIARHLYFHSEFAIEAEDAVLSVAPWMRHLTDPELDDLAGAAERLLFKLERHGAATRREEERVTAADDGSTTAVAMNVFSLVEPIPYPETIIASETTHTPMERSLMEFASRLDLMAQRARAKQVDLAAFEGELAFVAGLTSRVSNTGHLAAVPRSETRDGIRRAEQLSNQLFEQSIDQVVRKWAEPRGVTVIRSLAEADPRTGAACSASLGEFPDLVALLSAGEIAFHLLSIPTTENQLLVLSDLREDAKDRVRAAYSASLSDEKGRARREQRLPVVDVVVTLNGEPPPIPTEVVEIVGGSQGFSLYRLFFGQPAIREAVEVAGWNIATLDTELDGLDGLTDELSRAQFLGVE
jgi:hypothetical protein